MAKKIDKYSQSMNAIFQHASAYKYQYIERDMDHKTRYLYHRPHSYHRQKSDDGKEMPISQFKKNENNCHSVPDDQ